jgi:hypothetical protein
LLRAIDGRHAAASKRRDDRVLSELPSDQTCHKNISCVADALG